MRAAVLLLAALALGCESPTAPAVVGEWGGTQASLTLSLSGGAITYPCGAGTIDPAWTLSGDGTFSASGEHFFGGGPVPIGGAMPHPAHYTGQVAGDVLTLSVTLLDLNETLGPFRLVRGGPPVHEMCV